MSRAIVLAAPPLLAARLRAGHPELEIVPPGQLPTDPTELLEQLGGGEVPGVVVLGAAAPIEELLHLAGALDGAWPGVVLVLAGEPTPELWPSVVRAGIRDVMPADGDVEVLAGVLDRVARSASAWPAIRPVPQSTGATGRVIAVVSPKGGVGKTTVSTNLAVGLAAVAPQSTVVIDLDVQFGDVATALNLTPEYTLPDAVHGRASEDSMVLKTFLTQHPTGLYAVCGSDSPAAGDTVTGAEVTRLVAALARQFQYVVIDTAPGLSEQTLAALDQATDAVLLSSMDVPGVRGLRKEIDVLTELGLMPRNRHVVLNFTDPKEGLALPDVETTLGTGVDVLLPRSAAVPGSTNEGVPLLQSNRKREPATAGMRQLLERIVPPAEPQSTGWWPRQKAAS